MQQHIMQYQHDHMESMMLMLIVAGPRAAEAVPEVFDLLDWLSNCIEKENCDWEAVENKIYDIVGELIVACRYDFGRGR